MKESTEEKILTAAIEVFIKKGFAGARMQEIADNAGINKAMLHYYFRSKKALFRIIIERTIGKIIPKLAEAIDNEGTVMEKFEFIIKTYIQTLREHPHLPVFILHELSQNREEFVIELKTKLVKIPDFQKFFQQMMLEMGTGKIKTYHPFHLFINIVSLCVFPFAARPVFKNILEIQEDVFDNMMEERANQVISFVRSALAP